MWGSNTQLEDYEMVFVHWMFTITYNHTFEAILVTSTDITESRS